jgi:DNA polymerase III alpha subunit
MPKIVSAKRVGSVPTYDLGVAHPDHQFYLSNGLLTSNSHSYSYAVMSMQCAWLATYYPLEFYSALLTLGKTAELQDYVSDIKRAGVPILPVDINKSKRAHVIEKGEDGKEGIRLSLRSILGVGDSAIDKILAGQPYTDWLDFVKRSDLSKTAIMPLIMVGALGSLVPNVKKLETAYQLLLDKPKYRLKKRGKKEGDVCWDDYAVHCGTALAAESEDYKPHELVFFENSLMGFSARGSPFEILDRRKKIEALVGEDAPGLETILEGEEETFMVPAVLREVRERPQRNKQMMAFLKFGSLDGTEFDCACFGNIWRVVGPTAKRGNVYLVTLSRDVEDDEKKLSLGRPGWAHSVASCQQYMIDLDQVTL